MAMDDEDDVYDKRREDLSSLFSNLLSGSDEQNQEAKDFYSVRRPGGKVDMTPDWDGSVGNLGLGSEIADAKPTALVTSNDPTAGLESIPHDDSADSEPAAAGAPSLAQKNKSQPLPVGVEPSANATALPQGPTAGVVPPANGDFKISNPVVQDYMQKLLGDKYSDSARQQIVDQNNQDSSGPNWSAGLAALGAGLQGENALQAGLDFKKNEQSLRDTKLANFDKGRQGLIDNAKTGIELQKAADEQKNLGDERDPNSPASKLAQQAAAKMGISPDVAKGMTADQFKKQGPIFEKIYQVEQNRLARSDARQASHDAKATTQQNQAVQSVTQLLESARGNPAAAQAEKDLYSAQKANTLMNMYGDPNQLSMPQVRLLASEVAKIASGGVPGAHELDGITPSSLTGKLSEITSKLTNKPTPANAAAFVKQYQDYTKGLTADAQKVIKDKYGRVIDVNKSRLGDENYKNLKANYIDRFDAQSEPPLANNSADDHASAKQWLDDPKNKKNPKLYAAVKAKFDAAVTQQASNGL
jgi:hypothetical protein